MFKDIENSTEVSKNFQENVQLPVDMKVQVLTSSYWPPYVPAQLNIPNEVYHLSIIIMF